MDGAAKTGVVSTVTYNITADGKPVANAAVSEKNSSTATLDGTPHNLGSQTGPGATDSAGNLKDTVGLLAPAGTPADDKALIQTLSTGKVNFTDTQTLTFSAPNGATCSCTTTRTLTNVGSDGKASSAYTVTVTPKQPVVTTVNPQP